jgi:hypothetical protein
MSYVIFIFPVTCYENSEEGHKILLLNQYRCAPVSTDSVSAVSVIRSSSRPETKIGKLKK